MAEKVVVKKETSGKNAIHDMSVKTQRYSKKLFFYYRTLKVLVRVKQEYETVLQLIQSYTSVVLKESKTNIKCILTSTKTHQAHFNSFVYLISSTPIVNMCIKKSHTILYVNM